MAVLTKADFRACFGKSTSGKSTLARSWIAQARRVIIFDPNGEPDWAAGADVTSDPAELVALAGRKGRSRICWRGVMTGGVEAFEWGNRCAWAGEDYWVVWDEVERFCVNSQFPPVADKLVQAGRHRGCRIIACTRRPKRMPIIFRSLATRMAVFRMTAPEDINFFVDMMGRELADQLPMLRDYHAIDWTETGASIKKSPFR